MKPVLKASVLFCVTVIGGSIFAQFHPLVFTDENHSKNSLNSENIERSFIHVSEHRPITENLAVLLALPEEALNEELAVLFSKKDWDTDFLRVSAEVLFRKLVRDNPRQALMLLSSKTFWNASEKVQWMTVKLTFRNLADCYPDSFSNVIVAFQKGNMDFLNKYGIFAFRSFFDEIMQNDPEGLYTYMTDGNMDRFLELICRDISGENDFAKSLEGYREALWQQLIANIGVHKRDIFLAELNKLPKKNGWFYERYHLLKGFVSGITEKNAGEVLAWAMENLKQRDKELFVESYFDSLEERNADSREFIFFFKNIDKELLENVYVENAVQSIARKDPVGAIDLVNLSLHGYQRERALMGVLCTLNKKKSVQEMLPIINGLSDGMCKDKVAQDFLEKYYAESPNEAVAWVRENFTYVDQEHLLQRVQGDAYQERIVMDENGKPKEVERIMACGGVVFDGDLEYEDEE